MTKNKCQTCNDTKAIYCLPNSNMQVHEGYQKQIQKYLDLLDAGQLEKRSCPLCQKINKKKPTIKK